jgi:hypothetical protein
MNRTFSTGANRNSDDGKLDIEGFINPLALQTYCEYMHKHRHLEDGTLRASDNWQKLFGEEHISVCTKSLLRHAHDVWMENRGYESREGIDDALGGVIFNAFAIWLKVLEDRRCEDVQNVKKN